MIPLLLRNTLLDLERVLVENVEIWTADFLLKSPLDKGAVPVPPTIYQGYVPSIAVGQNMVPKAPSIAIKAMAGRWKREYGKAEVHFAILTWDPDVSRAGYQDLHNLGWRIMNGLYEQGPYTQYFQMTDEELLFEHIEDPDVDFFPYFTAHIQAEFGIGTPVPNHAPYGDVGPDTIKVSSESSFMP